MCRERKRESKQWSTLLPSHGALLLIKPTEICKVFFSSNFYRSVVPMFCTKARWLPARGNTENFTKMKKQREPPWSMRTKENPQVGKRSLFRASKNPRCILKTVFMGKYIK